MKMNGYDGHEINLLTRKLWSELKIIKFIVILVFGSEYVIRNKVT